MAKTNKNIRKSRSPVLFDYDDFLLLTFLNNLQEKVELPILLKWLNISHNSFLIHIKRLEQYQFIEVVRGKDKDYKNKFISITEQGTKALEVFKPITNKEPFIKHMEYIKDKRLLREKENNNP